MILVGGLTPAWQQILSMETFQPGQVNRACDVHWCASGKLLNVARALFHLQSSGLTLCPVGGLTGLAIQREFAADQIPIEWLEVDVSTRVCTTILDSSQQQVTELVENAPELNAEALKLYAEQFRDHAKNADVLVLTGSLPANTPSSFYRDLIADASQPVILDVRGAELLECLSLSPLLVKPNRSELEQTLGRKLVDTGSLRSAMRTLIEQGAQSVLVTDGADPAWLVTRDCEYEFCIPSIKVLNSIASGDSLTAGIAACLLKGTSLISAVQHGLACAIANAETLLPVRWEASRVEELQRLLVPVSHGRS